MLLVKGGRVMDPASGTDEILDILIKDDRIVRIGKENEVWDYIEEYNGLLCLEQLDADGLMVVPGFVDVHSHFRDPGFTYKEDIETGSACAAAGGYTSVVLMANTNPVVDNEETLSYVLEKGKRTGIHVYSSASISMGLKGLELVPMRQLMKAGAVGFTDDGIPLCDEEFVRKAMTVAAELGVPLSFHEEDKSLITNNGINAGLASEHYGVKGSPREAEISLIGRDIELSVKTGAVINIQHISSAEGVELVRLGKMKSDRIHAEATPHHIALTEEACIRKGTLAKMNPPLRTEKDRKAILEGLADGTIDIIATDHAPHSREEKNKPITEAPSGILGLETAYSVCRMNLVENGYLTDMQLLEKLTVNPARLYGIDAGYLAEGGPADLCLIDPSAEWIYENSASKSENSPFLGEMLRSKVLTTVASGRVVYMNYSVFREEDSDEENGDY